MTRIRQMWVFPLKGALGERQVHLSVDPDVGALGDRQYGLKRKASMPDEWAPKAAFYVCMNTPGMAAVQPAFDWIQTKSDNGANQLRDGFAERVGERLGLSEPPTVLNTHGRFNLTDTRSADVSFLNLASVEALSAYMGVEIDPRRFRMNVWLEGLPPFEELSWVTKFPGDQEIMVGEVPFVVTDACERCKAPHANPQTGTFDLDITTALRELMSGRNYASPHRQVPTVMGILARPLGKGRLWVGDRVTPPRALAA